MGYQFLAQQYRITHQRHELLMCLWIWRMLMGLSMQLDDDVLHCQQCACIDFVNKARKLKGYHARTGVWKAWQSRVSSVLFMAAVTQQHLNFLDGDPKLHVVSFSSPSVFDQQESEFRPKETSDHLCLSSQYWCIHWAHRAKASDAIYFFGFEVCRPCWRGSIQVCLPARLCKPRSSCDIGMIIITCMSANSFELTCDSVLYTCSCARMLISY